MHACTHEVKTMLSEIRAADEPSCSSIAWIQLGNGALELSSTRICAKYGCF